MTSSNLPLLFAIFCLLSFISAGPVDPQPKMIVEVFRHGARGPIFDFTNVWNKKLGELTGVGMRMHYLLGAALKDRYPTLFDKYDPAKIILRSTDVNRTIMSAYSQLYGIYGGSGLGLTGAEADILSVPPYIDYDPSIAKDLTNDAALPNKFQVLPLHIDSVNSDRVLRSLNACPLADEWAKENGLDEEATNVFNTELAHIAEIMTTAGLDAANIQKLNWIGDTAVANKFQNLPIPGDVDPNSQDYLDVRFAFEWHFFKAFGSGKNEAALHSLYLLNNIQDYILGYLNGTSSANFVLLSGHDSTLLPLLVAFGVTTKDCLLANYKAHKAGEALPNPNCIYPTFASNVVFEVYGQSTADAYVKFYYNNVAQPICGKTGDDSNKCTLKEFADYIKKVTKGYTYEYYETTCGIKAAEMPVITVSTYSGINLGLGLACAVLAAILILTCNISRKQDSLLERDSEKTRSLLY